jgi:hypothetical protein
LVDLGEVTAFGRQLLAEQDLAHGARNNLR